MTDDLIARLSSDLRPIPPRAIERRLWRALLAGLAITSVTAWLVLDLTLGRPFGGAFGGPMFWVKMGYTAAFGLIGLAAAPVLTRPDGRIIWPLLVAGLLVLLALALGTMDWMRADWSMPVLMGNTAMVCPWLITLTGLPVLAMLLAAMRSLAPRSPTLAGFAAGLVAGGFGALVYAFYCGETGMMFMAVWYSLGIAMTALLGAIIGKFALRW
ncbi:hypothetical protein ASD83_09400 [Devosia sp. Root685]|uniref:DUF1109 domain-containing protein n=1 Tax=Devosia sp. Root685 TaxID=1736587 RepID=UPI0006FCED06|nr:DUF1109 domain-containing protein [Devosia sp. Root685]KRA97349.1 hypothetical protein ASD83_09400 [Devosia sp. Root685]